MVWGRRQGLRQFRFGRSEGRCGIGDEEIYALDAPVLVFPGDNIRIPERYF